MTIEGIQAHKSTYILDCPEKYAILDNVLLAKFENHILYLAFDKQGIKQLREEVSNYLGTSKGFRLELPEAKIWYHDVNKIKQLKDAKHYIAYIPSIEEENSNQNTTWKDRLINLFHNYF